MRLLTSHHFVVTYYDKGIMIAGALLTMGLAGIELRYLVNIISEQATGYYISNIYGITKESILFKLHHSEKPDIFLMLTTFGMWITRKRIDPVEPHRMIRRLRSDLLRLRITRVRQLGEDRIAAITFAGPDKEFIVVAEFFGGGNIILCSPAMKILALQRSLAVRHRTLKVGAVYVLPPQGRLDIFNLAHGQFDPIRLSDLDCRRWVGRNLGLPSRYTEEILAQARVDPTLLGRDLTMKQRDAILDAARDIIGRVSHGPHDPVIIRGEELVACPIRAGPRELMESVSSFDQGLDTVFTERVVKEAKQVASAVESGRIAQTQIRLEEQDAAIRLVEGRVDAIAAAARLLLEAVSNGHTALDGAVVEELKRQNVQPLMERGSALLQILDKKIKIDQSSSLHTIASALFDEAKKQSAAIPGIKNQKKKTERELAQLQIKEKSTRKLVAPSEIRRKSWFERYRWFITSDGNLAVGGRDASSNSSIVRKRLEKNDRVFHAEIHGSPFFILKDCPEILPASIEEVAHATICFSRAWKEAMYGMSAYWVNPQQVRKAAPSGQFLPRGSFAIDGRRNFVRISALSLCVGILERDGDYLLECGPPSAVRLNSLWHAVIEPGSSEPSDVAKRIRAEFITIDEDVSARFTVDDFLRVLPAGRSRVVKVVHSGR